MYRISNTAKNALENSLGISFEQLNDMSPEEERSWIENKIGHRLVFCKSIPQYLSGRGNPLLARRKIRTKEDLDKKSRILFGI